MRRRTCRTARVQYLAIKNVPPTVGRKPRMTMTRENRDRDLRQRWEQCHPWLRASFVTPSLFAVMPYEYSRCSYARSKRTETVEQHWCPLLSTRSEVGPESCMPKVNSSVLSSGWSSALEVAAPCSNSIERVELSRDRKLFFFWVLYVLYVAYRPFNVGGYLLFCTLCASM
jgi:hypothetical protein